MIQDVDLNRAARILRNNGVGIIPTDTLYGLAGSALSKNAVKRIYKLKQRKSKKPLIVLIGSTKELARFNVKPDTATLKLLKHIWPGPVSLVLPCQSKKFAYLHRATKTLAFRLPKPRWLLGLLGKTGPLVVPSANPKGAKPATTIAEARKYFGNKVDFYLNTRKKLMSAASTLIAVKGKEIRIIRQGATKISGTA